MGKEIPLKAEERQFINNGMRGMLGHVVLPIQDGDAIDIKSVAEASETASAIIADSIIKCVSTGKMADSHYVARLFVARELFSQALDGIYAAIADAESITPDQLEVAARSFAARLSDVHNDKRHIDAIMDMAKLAFDPVDFPGHTFFIPEQLDRIDVTGTYDDGRPYYGTMAGHVKQNGVEMDAAQEVRIRLGRMRDYLKAHTEDIFEPRSDLSDRLTLAEQAGYRVPSTPAMPSEENENDEYVVEQKLDILDEIKDQLTEDARNQAYVRMESGKYMMKQPKDVIHPPMAYAKTYLDAILYANNPRRSAIDLGEKHEIEHIETMLDHNAVSMLQLGESHPEVVFADCKVGLGTYLYGQPASADKALQIKQ